MTSTQHPSEGASSTRPVVVLVGAGSKHGRLTEDVKETEGSAAPPSSSTEPGLRWGLGGALALTFAKEGYDIVLMGRRREVLMDIQKMVEDEAYRGGKNSDNGDNEITENYSTSTPTVVTPQDARQHKKSILCAECDVTDDESVRKAFEETEKNILDFGGYIDLVIFNVAPPYPPNFRFEGWGDVLLPHMVDCANSSMQHDTQVNGLVRVTRHTIPGMMDRQRGCVLLAGESCCNLAGRYEFASVAPARAALRALSQSMFRAYGPMGIHVCNINIGGIIASPKTKTWTSVGGLTHPLEVAEQFLSVYRQKPTVWSYELQLTPSFRARDVDTRM